MCSSDLDKDPNDGIVAGADWRGELISQLRRSRAVIAVCTPEYQRSPWCMAELGIALDRGKLLIPLQLGGPDVVPLLLQDKQAIQLDPLAFDASASDATTTTNAAAATTSTAATTATSCDDARLGLQRRLAEAISWRDKLRWEAFDQGRAGQRPFHRSPFPGLKIGRAHV